MTEEVENIIERKKAIEDTLNRIHDYRENGFTTMLEYGSVRVYMTEEISVEINDMLLKYLNERLDNTNTELICAMEDLKGRLNGDITDD